jgi:hypothetical protein
MRFIPIASAFFVVGFSAMIHGRWTDRWTTPALAADTTSKMAQVPMTVGEWDGETVELADPREVAGLYGNLYRRYVQRSTGNTVLVSLVWGRRGPIAIHTPDMCYVASGYEMTETPAKYVASEPIGGSSAEFFVTRFRKARPDSEENLRVFWAWNAGSGWKVADNPRIAFARHPILYKLYLIRSLNSTEETGQEDPCVAFMRDFLPELHKALSEGV